MPEHGQATDVAVGRMGELNNSLRFALALRAPPLYGFKGSFCNSNSNIPPKQPTPNAVGTDHGHTTGNEGRAKGHTAAQHGLLCTQALSRDHARIMGDWPAAQLAQTRGKRRARPPHARPTIVQLRLAAPRVHASIRRAPGRGRARAICIARPAPKGR